MSKGWGPLHFTGCAALLRRDACARKVPPESGPTTGQPVGRDPARLPRARLPLRRGDRLAYAKRNCRLTFTNKGCLQPCTGGFPESCGFRSEGRPARSPTGGWRHGCSYKTDRSWCRRSDVTRVQPCTGGSICSPLGCCCELRSSPRGSLLHETEVDQRQLKKTPFVVFFVWL